MKNLILLFCLAVCLACTNNFIDTGVSNGKHDCSMYDYFLTNSYDWDSTRLIIERGGLKYMFDGTDEAFSHMTFFGPTNHSVRRWMLERGYERVADIPVDTCAVYIERYVYQDDRLMRADFEFEVKGTSEGGTYLTKLDGGEIRVFRRTTDWNGIADAGPEELYVHTFNFGANVMVASADIETLTGVVHSLCYTHRFGEF